MLASEALMSFLRSSRVSLGPWEMVATDTVIPGSMSRIVPSVTAQGSKPGGSGGSGSERPAMLHIMCAGLGNRDTEDSAGSRGEGFIRSRQIGHASPMMAFTSVKQGDRRHRPSVGLTLRLCAKR